MLMSACIIPFYNEGERVLHVLHQITKARYISHIICVDDGSTDTNAQKIRKHFPSITLLRHPENRGKSEAVRTGCTRAKEALILLVDADLSHISVAHFDRAIEKMKREEKIGMVLFRHATSPFHVRLLRTDIILSGERLLRKKTS